MLRSLLVLSLLPALFLLFLGARPVSAAETPNSVDIIYEAATYIPPFYKGKALPGSESLVKIVAIPNVTLKNGSRAREENLSFTWKRNSKVLGANSGIGRSSVLLKTGRLPGDSDVVEVVVTAEDGASAERVVAIQSFSPFLSLYPNDPVLGILLEGAVGENFPLRESEASLVAYPYFFEVKDRNSPAISYAWSLGGARANGKPNSPSEIILRRGSDAGSISLSLSVQNPSKILEVADLSTTISFPTGGQAPF